MNVTSPGADPGSSGEGPRARLLRPAGGCLAVVEVDVPATVDEVWESVATGPGYSRWFVPAELEPRVGGRLVTHHGDFGEAPGTITAWAPPHRYAYVESDWQGDGTPVPDWTTEITVHRLYPTEPESGPGPGVGHRPGDDAGPPRTRVRLTSGVETEGERWGEDIAGTVPGWVSALRLLADYHAHFPGREVVQALVMREVSAGHLLPVLLGLDGAGVGHRATARGAAGGRTAEVSGAVVEVTGGDGGQAPTRQGSVTLRVLPGEGDAGAVPGVYEFGTMQYGQTRMSVVRGYLYPPAGTPAADLDALAGRVRGDWSAVLDGLLAGAAGEVGPTGA